MNTPIVKVLPAARLAIVGGLAGQLVAVPLVAMQTSPVAAWARGMDGIMIRDAARINGINISERLFIRLLILTKSLKPYELVSVLTGLKKFLISG